LAAGKIKARRKELQKAEEILGIQTRLADWLQTHLWQVLIGGAAVLVVAVLVLAIGSYRQFGHKRAQTQYAQLADRFPGGENPDPKQWEGFVPALKSLVEEYPYTSSALSAQLDLAQALYQLKQYEQALQWDVKNLQRLSEDTTRQALVRYRMALCYQAINRLDEAIAQLEMLAPQNLGVLLRDLHWQLAQLYANKQEPAKAVEQCQKALDTLGGYPNNALLQERLAVLRLSVPLQSEAAEKNSKP
jgi:predicted negative regulator of RcsB-dependent stress response